MVITPLSLIVRALRVAAADRAAEEQSGSCTNRRTGSKIARCAADSRTCCSAKGRADYSAPHCRLLRGLLTANSAYLLEGILAAYGIVRAELIETLALAGQRHDARSRRHCRTSPERYNCYNE